MLFMNTASNASMSPLAFIASTRWSSTPVPLCKNVQLCTKQYFFAVMVDVDVDFNLRVCNECSINF